MFAAALIIGGLYMFIKNIVPIVLGATGFYGIDGFIGTWGGLILIYLVLSAIL
jgi:hypothetical protein